MTERRTPEGGRTRGVHGGDPTELTLAEARRRAAELGVAGTEHMGKDELADAVAEATRDGGTHPA